MIPFFNEVCVWGEVNYVANWVAEGPGAVVKAACLESLRSLFRARSGIQVSKKQNVSSPLTRINLILWGASDTERKRSRP